MKTTLLALITIAALGLHAQTAEEFLTQGDKLYDEGKYLESAKAYDQAFEKGAGTYLDFYNAACSWALTGDTIHAMKHLKTSAEKGWVNLKHIKRDADLKTLHTVKGWTDILTIVQANVEEYEKNFNKPLKEQLEKIYVRDQTLRQLYREAEEKFGRDSDEMKYFWQLVSQEDRINEAEVEEIIKEHGWVGKSTVGGQANTTLWLVIQHAPLETQEKYLPLLKESVKKGESSGGDLALLEDRILMRNNKPQTYGSQVSFDPDTGKHKVYDIADPEYVNQRRKEVGLGPIEDYLKHWNIEWTVVQKTK